MLAESEASTSWSAFSARALISAIFASLRPPAPPAASTAWPRASARRRPRSRRSWPQQGAARVQSGRPRPGSGRRRPRWPPCGRSSDIRPRQLIPMPSAASRSPPTDPRSSASALMESASDTAGDLHRRQLKPPSPSMSLNRMSPGWSSASARRHCWPRRDLPLSPVAASPDRVVGSPPCELDPHRRARRAAGTYQPTPGPA